MLSFFIYHEITNAFDLLNAMYYTLPLITSSVPFRCCENPRELKIEKLENATVGKPYPHFLQREFIHDIWRLHRKKRKTYSCQKRSSMFSKLRYLRCIEESCSQMTKCSAAALYINIFKLSLIKKKPNQNFY